MKTLTKSLRVNIAPGESTKGQPLFILGVFYMFNFGAINAYITTGDLLIVALWAKEEFPNYMVDGIKRQKDTRIYTVSFNAAQHGFDKKIEINEKDEIVILNSENGGVWMS